MSSYILVHRKDVDKLKTYKHNIIDLFNECCTKIDNYPVLILSQLFATLNIVFRATPEEKGGTYYG